ncbi:MAG: replicative DNA helicase, partial [bacterium]
NALKDDKQLEKIGGAEQFLHLMNAAPSFSNIRSYCKIVKDKSNLRRLIAIAEDQKQAGFNATDADAAISAAEDAIYRLSAGAGNNRMIEAGVALGDMIENMADAWLQPDGIVGVPTGFNDLDHMLSGLRRAAMIILGARPAMGKSALAANIATNVAIDQGLPVLYFSLEMGTDEIMQRILASRAHTTLNYRDGRFQLSNDDWVRINTAAREIDASPLIVDSDATITVQGIGARARKARAHYGQLGLVVVDYLQLMTGHDKYESRQQEVSEISRRLKILSVELDAPILALSQLSRSLEGRQDKRPMLSDLRESGSLEQDADVVMFLYRDSEYNPESEEQGTAELIVSKHRQGGKGIVKLGFIGPQTRFATIAKGL